MERRGDLPKVTQRMSATWLLDDWPNALLAGPHLVLS